MNNTQAKSIPVARLTIILGALASIGAFGTDMYLSGFPMIAQYFDASAAEVQTTLSVYFIGLAAGQLLYGPLVDHYGRRGPLVAGLAVFTASSLCIAFSPNIHLLIGLRLVQAAGGCSGMIVGRAIVTDLFGVRESSGFLSMLAVVQGLAPIIAPTMGSILMGFWGWESVFYFMTVFGLVCLAASAAGLPETLEMEKRRDIRVSGIVNDYTGLFARRSFIVPAFASGLAGASMFAYIAGSPFVFMHIFGVSPSGYGYIFAANGVGTIVAAQFNRWMLRHHQPQTVLTRVLFFGIVMVAALLPMPGHAPLWMFLIPLWFSVAVVPIFFANGMAIAMGACRDKAGSASAVVGLLQFGLASIASGVVSLLDNGTAYPMIGVMLACMILGAAVNAFAKNARHPMAP